MSLTKVPLPQEEIEALARAAFGSSARIAECRPAEGGMYNAGYHLRLEGAGPGRAFLKVAPPEALPCLTHERSLLRAEIDTLRKVAATGVGLAPAVLHADLSRRHAPRDAVFLQRLPGVLLSETQEASSGSLRREIGGIAAGIHTLQAEAFGYPGSPDLQAATWAEAFGLMIEALFVDAARLGADPSLQPLRARFAAALPQLEVVTRPSLVHYDLWDGNILVDRDGDGWTVTGLIDWERAFYGDPVAELVSLSFHNAMEPDAELLAAWSAVTGLGLDAAARRRMALYRAYLWMIMLVEAHPRGFIHTRPPEAWAAVRRRLERSLDQAGA